MADNCLRLLRCPDRRRRHVGVEPATGDPAAEAKEALNAQLRIAERKAQREVRAAIAERNRYLCQLKSTCVKYAQVRQQCATAGNFENCISVKMGNGFRSSGSGCTDDGNVDYWSSGDHRTPNGL